MSLNDYSYKNGDCKYINSAKLLVHWRKAAAANQPVKQNSWWQMLLGIFLGKKHVV